MQQQFATPYSPCPYCQYKADTATSPTNHSADPRPPAPGDITICCGCTGVCIYTEEIQLRKPTVAEWQEVLANPVYFARVKTVQQEIARLNPSHSRLNH